MSERKVLTKYYPPDFDPRQIQRARQPKNAGNRIQTVRLMAPFSMKCTSCGEYIYKGRKFNARKETPEEKYLGIQIFRFYIRCTRCSAEITFKTDPKNQDYACERGARRNTEPWRVSVDETDEQRLDRLEQEEEERNAMVELEAKTVDAKREMAVADALDEIRTRNAMMERTDPDGGGGGVALGHSEAEEAARIEREDQEAARRAFAFARESDLISEEMVEEDEAFDPMEMPPPPLPAFRPQSAPKKRLAPAPGIKRKVSEGSPLPEQDSKRPKECQGRKGIQAPVAEPLVDYGSDSD